MDLGDPLTAVIPTLDGQVLRVLSRTRDRMTAPAIARLVRRGSEPGVRIALDRLLSSGTVLAERVGRQNEYRANTDHAAWGAIRAAIQFADAFPAVLDTAITDTVGSLGADVTCALFGSVAAGTADADSDIDLVLVVADSDRALGVDLSARLTERLQRLTGNQTNVLLLTRTMQADLIARGDPLVGSWRDHARTITGPDLLAQHTGN